MSRCHQWVVYAKRSFINMLLRIETDFRDYCFSNEIISYGLHARYGFILKNMQYLLFMGWVELAKLNLIRFQLKMCQLGFVSQSNLQC